MKSILSFLEKNFKTIVLVLFSLIMFHHCSLNGKLKQQVKTNEQLAEKIYVLEKNDITREELEVLLEIHSLETARRVVYDNNTIVRTTQRPDDVMNQYDVKIKELKSKLK